MTFDQWERELMLLLKGSEYIPKNWKGPAIIDSRLPFDLGYTPQQAADALLGKDRKLLRELTDITLGEISNDQQAETDRPD